MENIVSHNMMGQPVTLMRIFTIVLYLSHPTDSEEQVQQFVIGEKGQNATLQCKDLPVDALSVRWAKNGVMVVTQNPSELLAHLSIGNNGSLQITELQYIDEGLYYCETKTPDGSWRNQSKIQLQITDGPTNISLNIKPATPLKNGTLFVKRSSSVFFNCSSEAYPSQNLAWIVEDAAQDNRDRASGSKSSLEFSISNILPSDQGIYTCASQNTFSMRTVNKSQELLVYYAPESHPVCSWELGKEPSDVLFICSWYGGYPVPTLDWHEVLEETVIAKGPMVNTSQETERLDVHVNRFILHDGEEVKCVGHHLTGVESSCSFNLKMPYPLGSPLVTALEGSAVTLSCTETESLPPAKTVWKHKDNKVINNTSKYIISESKPTYTLTIVNVTKADEGIFYCYSENPLGARELELYLTVKTSAGRGAAVGVLVSVLIVIIGIILSVTLYSKRDRICIGKYKSDTEYKTASK
ncbi:V-set and immunoglobulin domain-containing protein 10-like isoform X1 [Myxocyprinus asiaticus]|uniref:V-set and immunoglobulin domain-containing protein 10-like isoform X1 n=1 Tax=Myxocyprinus asiaticus TaxID=70543 RepID=UPI00222160DF|nr:V-set and immunoglobulin domain-containing protein 10-like isoform X1 [Myxocyprinus asiaticus]